MVGMGSSPDPLVGSGTFDGDDVEISAHVVYQRSDWPDAAAVGCHIKFSQ